MSAFHVLDAARDAGVEVRLHGKDLDLLAASEPPTDVIDLLRRHKVSIVTLLQRALEHPTQPWGQEDWRAYFNERAAIAEFDGHLPRPQAERRAFDCCVAEWLVRNPTYSSPDRCLKCEKSAKTDDPLLAIGVVGAGQAWLHGDCVSAWHSARLAAAVAALSGMNIVAAPGIRGPRSGPTRQMRGEAGTDARPRQNRSHAFMAQRGEPRDSRDEPPSLPWGARPVAPGG
jgi:hypothetical protein